MPAKIGARAPAPIAALLAPPGADMEAHGPVQAKPVVSREQ